VLGEASLRGRRCRVSESIEIATEVLVFIKDYHGLVLRRGDLHHVACRIRSSSSGDVRRVIGRIAIDLLSGRLAVKDRDKTQGSPP
jgi:hypothetical protein